MFLLALGVFTITGLLVTYPLSRIVRYLLIKVKMPEKSLVMMTFTTSLLLTLVLLTVIYGVGEQGVYSCIGYTISLLFWLYLDFQRLKRKSWIIVILDNTWFRYIFGTVLALFILVLTLNWFRSFDPYYLTPILITVLYMVFVYKRPRVKNRVLVKAEL